MCVHTHTHTHTHTHRGIGSRQKMNTYKVYCLSLLSSPAETVRSGMTPCSAEEPTPLGSTVAGLEAEAGSFGWAGGKNHFRLQ